MGSGPALTTIPRVMRAAFRGGVLVPFARHVAGAAAAFARRDQTSVSGNEGWIAKALRAGLAVVAELEAISVESHGSILAGVLRGLPRADGTRRPLPSTAYSAPRARQQRAERPEGECQCHGRRVRNKR